MNPLGRLLLTSALSAPIHPIRYLELQITSNTFRLLKKIS
jgi:hypothetical protein